MTMRDQGKDPLRVVSISTAALFAIMLTLASGCASDGGERYQSQPQEWRPMGFRSNK